ncbi:hypothetical protein [Wenxinia saemankumensis]|uniref:Uncharacterized protein n=1 Tax=Wenxinia saemankumensis TaxID=1447782 RepID=A0A1M6HIM6_9RHOB|nr:hypothetical protein [Wenxinia saemankumensis]SHJ22004.1 hypothetical protein SAMN05444417_3247 [Wenxinia saemankumensis]
MSGGPDSAGGPERRGAQAAAGDEAAQRETGQRKTGPREAWQGRGAQDETAQGRADRPDAGEGPKAGPDPGRAAPPPPGMERGNAAPPVAVRSGRHAAPGTDRLDPVPPPYGSSAPGPSAREGESQALFLARPTYRQKRLRDALKLMPALGTVLFMVPLLWRRGAEGVPVSAALIYLFAAWAGLILLAWLLSRRLRPGTRGEPARTGGTG